MKLTITQGEVMEAVKDWLRDQKGIVLVNEMIVKYEHQGSHDEREVVGFSIEVGEWHHVPQRKEKK